MMTSLPRIVISEDFHGPKHMGMGPKSTVMGSQIPTPYVQRSPQPTNQINSDRRRSTSYQDFLS